jgi:hypothetical protein
MNHLPQAPENDFFSKIRGDIRKSRCTTGIYDTNGKFATGVGISPRIFGKIPNGPNGIMRDLETDPCR